MSWIMVGTTVGGLALGAYQGDQKQKQQQKYNEGQAEITRYSPWTGMRGQVAPITDSASNGAITGAVSGLNFGAGLERNQGPKDASNSGLNFAPPSQPGQGALGSNEMVSELGQMGPQKSMYENMSPGGLGMFANNGYKFGAKPY